MDAAGRTVSGSGGRSHAVIHDGSRLRTPGAGRVAVSISGTGAGTDADTNTGIGTGIDTQTDKRKIHARPRLAQAMMERTATATPPLVIAVHGAVTNAATWLPLQRELGEGVEFAAPDLPGHGTNRETPFALEPSLKLIADLIPSGSAASDRPVVLVGDSLGGYLALLAAAAANTTVGAVIAGGCSFPLDKFAGTLVSATNLPVGLALLAGGKEYLEKGLGALLRRVTDPETAEAVLARGLRIEARAESLTALRTTDFRTVVAGIQSPVYFVNGAFDVPAAWLTRVFAGYASDGYAVTIPGAFHGCMLSHPRETAEVIRTAFVRSERRLAAGAVARLAQGAK